MTTTIDINGKPVKIELTAEQVQQIKNATINVFDLTTLEQVCAVAGEDIKDYKIPDGATKRQRGRILFATMELICDVFKEGKELDYANSNQYKYSLYGRYTPGSGFAFFGTTYDFTYTCVGARLSVDTDEKAQHIGTHFGHIWCAWWEGK